MEIARERVPNEMSGRKKSLTDDCNCREDERFPLTSSAGIPQSGLCPSI
jgi:hypothetical protein